MIRLPDLCSDFGQQYTTKEVAKLMKCSDDHIITLYKDGELEGIDIARKGAKQRELRFSEEALDAFAERRKMRAVPAAPAPKGKHPKLTAPTAKDDDYGSWFGQ